MPNTQTNKNQYKIPGGTTGQALVKNSNADFDFDWGTASGGGGGVLGTGSETFFGNSTVTAGIVSEANQIIQFHNHLLITYGTSNPNAFLQFGKDPNTGAIINEGFVPDFSDGGFGTVVNKSLSVSEDGNTLYALVISQQAFSVNGQYKLREYNSSLTLVNTYTGSFLGQHQFSGGGAFFVKNGHLIVEGDPISIFNADHFWTDFTLSGTSIINPLGTNLKYYTFVGTIFAEHSSALYRFGNSYSMALTGQSLPFAGVKVRTYDETTQTFGAVTQTLGSPISDWGETNTAHGAFEIPSLTTVGWWRNTTVTGRTTGGPGPVYYSAGIYNEYTQ